MLCWLFVFILKLPSRILLLLYLTFLLYYFHFLFEYIIIQSYHASMLYVIKTSKQPNIEYFIKNTFVLSVYCIQSKFAFVFVSLFAFLFVFLSIKIKNFQPIKSLSLKFKRINYYYVILS